MLKAISIIGFKKSGKTTLLTSLVQELKSRGHKVAAAKFSHHGLDKKDTDTQKMAQVGIPVIGLTQNEAAIFWPEKKYLLDLLPLVSADILLVEGGKNLTWLPRILVLKSKQEARDMDNGLALATWGEIEVPGLPRITSVSRLADLVLSKGFALAGIDCGTCNRPDCLHLAKEIVQGKASPKECAAQNTKKISITVNHHKLALNPFVEKIIINSILGMLSELKGYAPGKIKIEIDL
ncbi:molybdopterin-guanine dinucleotide biosynthesis protein MobB [Desulfovulcanus sp.]